MKSFLWGIDLGGTKIEGVILDSSDYTKPLFRERISTESEKGYDHILNRIAELKEILIVKSGLFPESIGFGTPGILDPQTNTMKNCNTTCLNGKTLKKDLEAKLNVPVKLANDANCFTLAENLFGAAKGAKSAFGIIMGTGVGGGFTINGKLHIGLHGIAGEWGHNVLIENGEPCYCGKNGCVEGVISGPALERYYYGLSGKKLSLPDILKSQDPHAAKTLERLITNFGKAISVVINILDPEIIVIGGGLSKIEAIYKEGPTEISKYIFNNKVSTKICQNSLGDSAGVFGAALLWGNF
jgi:fructokinase